MHTIYIHREISLSLSLSLSKRQAHLVLRRVVLLIIITIISSSSIISIVSIVSITIIISIRLTWFYDEEVLDRLGSPTDPMRSIVFEV